MRLKSVWNARSAECKVATGAWILLPAAMAGTLAPCRSATAEKGGAREDALILTLSKGLAAGSPGLRRPGASTRNGASFPRGAGCSGGQSVGPLVHVLNCETVL